MTKMCVCVHVCICMHRYGCLLNSEEDMRLLYSWSYRGLWAPSYGDWEPNLVPQKSIKCSTCWTASHDPTLLCFKGHISSSFPVLTSFPILFFFQNWYVNRQWRAVKNHTWTIRFFCCVSKVNMHLTGAFLPDFYSNTWVSWERPVHVSFLSKGYFKLCVRSQWDGSVLPSLMTQVSFWDPHAVKRESPPLNCPLTLTWFPMHAFDPTNQASLRFFLIKNCI